MACTKEFSLHNSNQEEDSRSKDLKDGIYLRLLWQSCKNFRFRLFWHHVYSFAFP
jgi:hypothetical protein